MEVGMGLVYSAVLSPFLSFLDSQIVHCLCALAKAAGFESLTHIRFVNLLVFKL